LPYETRPEDDLSRLIQLLSLDSKAWVIEKSLASGFDLEWNPDAAQG